MHERLVRYARTLALSAAIAAIASSAATAQKQYDTGVTDTEIKIGNTIPYSGPASAYGIIGKTVSAFFKMVNDNGGINGRKINFISYDDAYSPPKTVEQTRKLVESDEVFIDFAPLGTAPNAAIQGFLRPEASAIAPSTGDKSAIARPAAAIAKPHSDCPVAGSGAMLVAK